MCILWVVWLEDCRHYYHGRFSDCWSDISHIAFPWRQSVISRRSHGNTLIVSSLRFLLVSYSNLSSVFLYYSHLLEIMIELRCCWLVCCCCCFLFWLIHKDNFDECLDCPCVKYRAILGHLKLAAPALSEPHSEMLAVFLWLNFSCWTICIITVLFEDNSRVRFDQIAVYLDFLRILTLLSSFASLWVHFARCCLLF